MGWSFRKRIRILPGVDVNLGKSGAGVSVGPRGARVSAGSRGIHLNLGIPGTGLSYRLKIGRGLLIVILLALLAGASWILFV